jgi:hypothetical protein
VGQVGLILTDFMLITFLFCQKYFGEYESCHFTAYEASYLLEFQSLMYFIFLSKELSCLYLSEDTDAPAAPNGPLLDVPPALPDPVPTAAPEAPEGLLPEMLLPLTLL